MLLPVTVIQTKERKVSVMSAKPSVLPKSIEPTAKLEKTLPTKASGPSFNNAFTQFLMSQKSKADDPDPSETQSTPVLPVPVTNLQQKVIVEKVKQSPPSFNQFIERNKSPMTNVTPVQKQQEDWTNKILEQTQQQVNLITSNQRVTTERIQPYVSGQTNIYRNQVKAENGKQVFCTIVSSTNNSNVVQKQRQKMNQEAFQKNKRLF